MGVNGTNPSNSGPQPAHRVNRTGTDMMSSSQYLANHIRHHRQYELDVTRDPMRVYKPGNQIKFQFAERDFNPSNSFVEFDLVVEEIPCYDDMNTIVGNARQYFRDTIRSRPGVTFAEGVAPMHNCNHAMFIAHEGIPHTTNAASGTGLETALSDSIGFSSMQKVPTLDNWGSYMGTTNPLTRTFARKAVIIPDQTILVDPILLVDTSDTSSHPEQSTGSQETLSDEIAEDFRTKPLSGLPGFSALVNDYLHLNGTARSETNFSVTVDGSYVSVPGVYGDLYMTDFDEFHDSSWMTATGHPDMYQEMSEPGAVLNYRLRAMKFEPQVNYKMYESFVQQSVITPDESLAAWDPYGFALDSAITRNDAHGLFMRNIFALFRQIEVGTSSNPALIETYHQCQHILMMKSMIFENDTVKMGSNCYWSTSAAPSIFQWTKPTSMTLAFYDQYRHPEGSSDSLYQTCDRADLSNMTLADNRAHTAILNPFPFYKPQMVLPISIPLPLISDFFRDDFMPHRHMSEKLMLTLYLNMLGDCFDYAKCVGYSRDSAERVLDTTSFGNARDFIRNVLKVPNWGGWTIENFRLNMDYLEFHDVENGMMGSQLYLSHYLAMFQQGVSRPYQTYNHDVVGTTRGETLNTVRKGIVAPTTIYQQTTLNDGVLAMLLFWHGLDGVNAPMVPLHDTFSLEMGLHQNWRLPAIQNEFITLDQQQRDVLYLYNKNDTQITNPCTDLMWRFGNMSKRFQEIEFEYFYHNPKPAPITKVTSAAQTYAGITRGTTTERGTPLAGDYTYGFNASKYAGVHNVATRYDEVAFLGSETNSFPNQTYGASYLGGTYHEPAEGEEEAVEHVIDVQTFQHNNIAPLNHIYVQEATSDTMFAESLGMTYSGEQDFSLVNNKFVAGTEDYMEARKAALYNAQHPYKIYSQSNIFQPKKMSYHDTCFGVYDFRGDAPTPGSMPGAVMTGITTGAVLQNTLRMHFNIHDLSIGERFANRLFTHNIVKVMDRVVYYVPEGDRLRLMVETNPEIFTANAI